jgi:integrase/recombinase XerD
MGGIALRSYENQIECYLSFCEKQKSLSPHTLRAYRIDMAQFVLFLKKEFAALEDIGTVDKTVLKAYVQYVSEKYAVKTCKRKIATIKAFFNHLEFEDIIEVNPLRKVRTNFKEPQALPKTLKLSDVKHLLSSLYALRGRVASRFERFSAVTRIAVLEMLFSTGIRVGELCNLPLEALDLEQGCIRILGKGKKERMVYISSPEVLEAIKEYIELRNALSPSSDALFINWHKRRLSEDSVRNILKLLAHNLLGGRRVTPHMFRHTFASLLLEAGVDIKYIQELLGHSTIQTTLIYLHISNAAIKSALICNHPRSKFLLAGT